MENRIPHRLNGCPLPRNFSSNNLRANGYSSPKLFKRKPAHKQEGPLFKSRKDSSQSSMDSAICYISPTKKIPHSQKRCSGNNQLTSTASYDALPLQLGCPLFNSAVTNSGLDINQDLSVLDTAEAKTQLSNEQDKRNMGLRKENEDLKMENDCLRQQNECLREQNESYKMKNTSLQQYNDCLKQASKSLKQQNQSLKQGNISLQQQLNGVMKRLQQSQTDMKQLQQENEYLSTKMDEFNCIFLQKNQIIQKLEEFVSEREAEITKCKQLLHTERQNTCNLHLSLQSMAKSTLESTCWAETESGDNDREKLEDEISQLKHQITSLKRLLQKEELKDHLFNKLKHDYMQKLQNNKLLKFHNRRLIYKIEGLLKEIKVKEEICKKARLRLYHAEHRDDQLSLQLSPDKFNQ